MNFRIPRNHPQNPYRNRDQGVWGTHNLILVVFCLFILSYVLVFHSSVQSSDTRFLKGQNSPQKEVPELLLRFMTFNLRFASANDGLNSWKYRKNHLFSIINKYHPVVMGTQEGLKDQLREIHENLKWDYERFGVEREQNGEFEQIFYDKSMVTLLDGGNFWMSENPDIPGETAWGAPCVRMTTWCRFRLHKTSQEFYFFNTQFDHVSELSRNKSSQLLHTKIQELNPSDLPIIVVGDFNTYRYTDTYKYLTSSNGPDLAEAWMNAKDQIGDISYTYHGWQGRQKPEENGAKRAENHIDWILFRPKEMSVLVTEVITETRDNGLYPSDHYPIQSEILFPKYLIEEKESNRL